MPNPEFTELELQEIRFAMSQHIEGMTQRLEGCRPERKQEQEQFIATATAAHAKLLKMS